MIKIKEKFKLRSKTIVFALTAIFALSLVLVGHSLNFSFNLFQKASAQTTSLYITNIHISSLTSTAVTITWDTNLLSDSKVRIGTTASYNDFTCDTCYASPLAKTHRVSIGGLKANTTYHYQVVSKTDKGEEKTSIDRPFVTPGGSADKNAPFITYIKVGANDTDAQVTVYTSEEAHVAIAYGTIPRPNFDAYLPGENRVNDNALPFTVVHTLDLPPATAAALVPGTTYYYRLQAFDESGNSSQTGEFSFVTSDDGDRVFTTGQCDGNIPIGECSPGGLYCDVGTATLVSNCEHCGFRCLGGQTCQPGGVCSQDPGLTGDPYQCNRADCYKSCSGNDSISCVGNLECSAAGAGTCIDDGLFNIPAVSGCYGTYPRCDANVILKVKKDRECAKWLTCGTAIEQKNPQTNQTEELCLNLTACTALGKSNQCVSYVDLPKKEMTYRTPDEINKLKWLSGSVIAGLDWQYQEGSPLIRGFYPWSAMEEIGGKLTANNAGDDNYNFEATAVDKNDVNKDGETADLTYDISYWSSIFTKYPVAATNRVVISTDWDPVSLDQKDNRVLIIEGMNAIGQGAAVKIKGNSSLNSPYVLNMKIKSSESNAQKIKLDLSGGGSSGTTRTFGEYTIDSGWQKITSPAVFGVGGSETYLYIYVANDNFQKFYVDDIEIKPVLEVQSGVYLTRSCRLYPKEDSPSCEYTDDNGIMQKGWYGYCLQRDLKNDSVCLSWWPVDILSGESNLFGSEQAAGYTGREPLYYCAESLGSLTQTPVVTCQDLPRNPNNGSYCVGDNTNRECQEANCTATNGGFCYQALKEDDPARLIKNFRYGDNSAGQCGHLVYASPATPNLSKYLNRDNIIKVKTGFTWLPTCSPGHEWGSKQIELNPGNNWSGWDTPGRSGTFNCDYNKLYSEDWEDPTSIAYQCAHLQVNTYFNDCCAVNNWAAGVQLKFDDQGNFDRLLMVYSDNYPNIQNPACYGNGTFHVNALTFYPKELCTKVVEVVTEGGDDAAWADNIQSAALKIEDLKYKNTTDLNPFGGAVTPEGDPVTWTSPLSVEEPNSSLSSSPYQERAGKPYACVGNCSTRICWGGGGKDGETCQTELDCLDTINGEVFQGTCIGVGVCALKAGESSKGCTSDSDCPDSSPDVDDNYCIGGAASGRGEQDVTKWPSVAPYCWGNGQVILEPRNAAECASAGGSWYLENRNYFAELRIRGLFAQTYGYYKWSVALNRYEEQVNIGWVAPNRRCAGGKRVEYNPADSDTYCGIAPKISNIKLGDGASNEVNLGADGGKVKLTFNTVADSQQQPLKTIYIDWGDGQVISYNFQFKSKDNPDNPHVYTHAYAGCGTDSCRYEIKILAEDNWGWCSDQPESRPDSPVTCYVRGENNARWDPVDTNACSGGTCTNGVCSGDLADDSDAGRPCGKLTVILKD